MVRTLYILNVRVCLLSTLSSFLSKEHGTVCLLCRNFGKLKKEREQYIIAYDANFMIQLSDGNVKSREKATW